MTWQIGLGANTVIMAAYLAISVSVVLPLARSGQLRINPLEGLVVAKMALDLDQPRRANAALIAGTP